MNSTHEIWDQAGNTPDEDLFAQMRQQRANQQGMLVPKNDGLYYNRICITETGLVIPSDITIKEYEDVGEFLLDLSSRMQWLLGDWLAFGSERQWGETYQRIATKFDYEVETLYSYASVCRKVLIRIKDLSFSHHRLVMNMPPDMQRYWLEKALRESLSVNTLQRDRDWETEAYE